MSGSRVHVSLDDRLLADYIESFYGYGSYHGDWWLVGMEEGGGGSATEVARRLELWNARGRRELEDVEMFSSSPDLAKWFTPRPPLQPTWRGLIRLILAAEGRAVDPETARRYQGGELGRIGGNTCLLELLPLPSPSVGDWLYGEHSALPSLRSRQQYVHYIAPRRISSLRTRISDHRPRAVVFYSRNYQAWWEQIVGAPFGTAVAPGVHIVNTPHTVFMMTMHPTYRGLRTEYFVQAGLTIAELRRRADDGSCDP